MIKIPDKLLKKYGTELLRQKIAQKHKPHFKKWLRYYLDYCHKYNQVCESKESYYGFNEELKKKGQQEWQRRQAYRAVAIYYQMLEDESEKCVPEVSMSENPVPFLRSGHNEYSGSTVVQETPPQAYMRREVATPAVSAPCHPDGSIQHSENSCDSTPVNHGGDSHGAELGMGI